MDSRPLLKPVKRFRIILDSKTFDGLIREKSRLAAAILDFSSFNGVDWIRTPHSTVLEELRKATEFQIELAQNSTIHGISINRELGEERIAFGYRQEAIQQIAQVVLRPFLTINHNPSKWTFYTVKSTRKLWR